MDHKGQLSADFLFATLILMILITSIVGVASQGIDTEKSAELSKAKALGESIATSINSVYTSGNGQYVILRLPNDANLFNYTVAINNDTISSNATVAVIFNNKTTVSTLIPSDTVVQSIAMGPNEVYEVYNENNTIKFTKLS